MNRFRVRRIRPVHDDTRQPVLERIIMPLMAHALNKRIQDSPPFQGGAGEKFSAQGSQ